MGSTGTGRLSDYTGSKADKPGGPGGSSGEDKCNEPIVTTLEDVERCSYYINHQVLPEVNSSVSVQLNKRLFITTVQGETIGYIPTKFNYLAACIKSGIEFGGQVTSSLSKPIAKIQVHLYRI
jgi:hypothetical protein